MAATQGGDALGQQLLGQRRGADNAQGWRLIVFQAAGQALHRFEGVVHPRDAVAQFESFPSRLQAPAHTGKQHEAQLRLGIAQDRLDLCHWQLQPFGRRAEVAGLQQRLDHFDVA